MGSVAFVVNTALPLGSVESGKEKHRLRTAIATHELLPKGLDLESLSIETGRRRAFRVVRRKEVSLPDLRSRLLSGTQPLLPRVSDLPWHGISVKLKGLREALLLRRGFVRAEDLLREA